MLLPNQLTGIRILLTPIFLWLFLADSPLLNQLSMVVYLLAAVTDWYDGWLARKFNYITNWGKFLDPLADKILNSTAFIGFVAIGILPLWMVLIIVVRDLAITILRGVAEYKGVSFVTSFSAKVKTFIQMSFIYFLLVIYALGTIDYLKINYSEVFEILMNKDFIYFTMLIITLFTLYTGILYFATNKKLMKKIFTNEA